jgi:hypothetical protein
VELKKTLPTWDDLDIEITKNFDQLSDLYLAHYNKRIQIVNLLRNDIEEWVKLKLKNSRKWEITRGGLVENYPKVDRQKVLVPYGKCFFGLFIYLKKKNSKRNLVFIIEVSSFLNWYVGQWDGYGVNTNEIIFDLDDYEQAKSRMKIYDKELKTELVYTGTQYEDNEDRNSKWIGIQIDAIKLINHDAIIYYNDLFKDKILSPLFDTIMEK